MSDEHDRRSVSYHDVRRWLEETERDFHCHVSFEWFPMTRGDGRKVWALRCVAKWKGKGAEIVSELGVTLEWPNNDYKTPAAAMLRLLYDLDNKLGDRAEELAKAAQGQLRFA